MFFRYWSTGDNDGIVNHAVIDIDIAPVVGVNNVRFDLIDIAFHDFYDIQAFQPVHAVVREIV